MIFKKSILVLRTVDSGFHYKLDSGFQGLDSGFQGLDSGFPCAGFRIPEAKISWIPDSGFPYMGRSVKSNLNV